MSAADDGDNAALLNGDSANDLRNPQEDSSAKKDKPRLEPCCAPLLCLRPRSRADLCRRVCGIRVEDKCGVDSVVLFLNFLAALLHLIAFVTLLSIVVAWEVPVFTRPLEEPITVWEKLPKHTYPTCVEWNRNHSAGFPDDAACFETTNNGLFAIYKDTQENGELTLAYLILSFSALSFVFQGLRPFVGLQTPDDQLSYLDEVDRRVNWLRWVEYAFSATVMILAVSFLVSPHLSFSNAVLVSTSTAATQLCGLVGELMLEVDVRTGGVRTELIAPAWIIHFAGWVLQIGVFSAIFASYFLSVSYGDKNENAGSPPPFVNTIVVGIAVFYASFGIVQNVDFLDRTWLGDWISGVCCKANPGQRFELAYIALSLSAKIFLSAIVASNLWMNPDA